MDIKFIPATEASVYEMCDCGIRAFENDALDHALFPTRTQDQAEKDDTYNFRVARIRKRLQSSEWLYVLATTSIEGQAKILGYAGWISPPQEKEPEQVKAKNVAENEMELQDNASDAQIYPKGLDIEAYKHVMQVVEKAKKEFLGGGEHRVWYLGSLAVDPEFKGRGIASSLVKWGTDQADRDGLPAYLESTPAAVGMYKRCGFKVERKLSVIKNNDSHFLTVMIRMPGGSPET